MPGNEFIGIEEQQIINELFTKNNGIFYRYHPKAYYVKDFESAFAKYFKVKYTHAVSSGTAALKLSLQALGVKPGDEVITQSHTFIATVEAIVEVGATPVIVDIDKSLNMNPNALREAITSKTKVVIPVHMSGVACHMKKILRATEECGTNIKILEDNAQSPGATFHGQYTGTIGDVGIFSFDFGKTITTGEGGMVVTNDKKIYNIVSGLSDHGHANNPNLPRGQDDCIGIGFNYKMTELQGALGLVQLKRLRDVIYWHRRNKQLLIDGLKDIVELRQRPDPKGDIGSSLSFFLNSKEEADRFVKEWTKLRYGLFNLPDAARWHVATYWNHIPYISNGLKYSQELLDRTIAIPIMAKYTNENINKRIEDIKQILKEIKK